jgi:polar amino acid transport system permease protein
MAVAGPSRIGAVSYTFRFGPVFARSMELLQGLEVTLSISAFTITCGLIVGMLGAIAARSRSVLLRRIVRVYVEVIRNTPVLAQLFFIFFGLPGLGIRMNVYVAANLSLTLYMGAYATEIIRGGIDAVPFGQTEAALALGLTQRQAFFLVVLRQALKVMFPALASQCTLLFLTSSLTSQIGIRELFHAGSRIETDTFLSFEVYAIVSLIYLICAVIFRASCSLAFWLLFRERERRPSMAELPT